MNFANKVISFFISGIFAFTWIVLFFIIILFSFGNCSRLCCFELSDIFHILIQIKAFDLKDIFPMMIFLMTIFLLPAMYALGVVVNTICKPLFGLFEKQLRKDELLNEQTLDKVRNSITQKGNNDSVPSFIFNKNISLNDHHAKELYHYFRYQLYLSNPEITSYLNFHRESIRILRSTSFNFSFISLFSMFLILLIFSNCQLTRISLSFYIISTSFAFLSSIVCFFVWRIKQRYFYNTIIESWIAKN